MHQYLLHLRAQRGIFQSWPSRRATWFSDGRVIGGGFLAIIHRAVAQYLGT
jgi:hypothetical protein